MPFGPYKDFAACVVANKSKKSPEAFCAATHKKITGKFPTEASSIGFYQLMMQTTELSLSMVPGVKIVCTGSFTDANGKEFSPSPADLSSIVDAYNDSIFSRIPVKLGHTSDSFNKQIADAFGLPELVLTGEGDGQRGAANLGEFKNLRLVNDTVVADVEVQEPIAGMMKDKLIRNLSMEIYNDLEVNGKHYSMAVRAGSLLGMENPALPLDDLTVLENGLQPTHVMLSEFQLQDEPEFQGFPLYEVPVENRTSKRVELIHVNARSAADAQSVAIGAAEKLTGESATIIGKAIGGIIAILLGKKFLFGPGKIVGGVGKGGDVGGKIKNLLLVEPELKSYKVSLHGDGLGTPGIPLPPIDQVVPSLPVMTPNPPYNVMLISESGEASTISVTAASPQEAIAKALLIMGEGWEFADIALPGEPLAASQYSIGLVPIGEDANLTNLITVKVEASSQSEAIAKAKAQHPGTRLSSVAKLLVEYPTQGENDMAEHPESFSVTLSKGDETKTVTVQADSSEAAKSKAEASNSGWNATSASKSMASEQESIGQIRAMLELGEDVDIVEAVRALKGTSTNALSEANQQNLQLQGRVQVLEKNQRRAHWLSEVTGIKIAGKSEELAEKLLSLEETGGKSTAEMLLGQWKDMSQLSESNGWFETRLSASAEAANNDFEAKVSELAEKNPDKARADIYKMAMVQHPELYQEYARVTGGRQ